jgi:hypothetical protein
MGEKEPEVKLQAAPFEIQHIKAQYAAIEFLFLIPNQGKS